jgi:hypothetical protein
MSDATDTALVSTWVRAFNSSSESCLCSWRITAILWKLILRTNLLNRTFIFNDKPSGEKNYTEYRALVVSYNIQKFPFLISVGRVAEGGIVTAILRLEHATTTSFSIPSVSLQCHIRHYRTMLVYIASLYKLTHETNTECNDTTTHRNPLHIYIRDRQQCLMNFIHGLRLCQSGQLD